MRAYHFFYHGFFLDWVGPEMACSPHTTTNRSGRRGGLERDLKWIQFQHELVDPHILTYLRCGGRHHDHKFSKAKVTVTIKAALQSFQTPSGPAPLLRWNGGTWVIWSTYSNLAHLPKVYVIAMVVFVSSSDRLFRSDIIGCILNEKSNQNP